MRCVLTLKQATLAYLATRAGRAIMQDAKERWGYSYQRALALAVLLATGEPDYDIITAVVSSLMAPAEAA